MKIFMKIFTMRFVCAFALLCAAFYPAKAQVLPGVSPDEMRPGAPPTPKEKQMYGELYQNAQAIGVACLMKAADENGVFKITSRTFRKDISPYLKNKNAFTSPFDKPGTASFVFNKELENVLQKKIKNADKVVMAYEPVVGKPLLRKPQFKNYGAAIVVFADGHAAYILPQKTHTLIWKP